MSMEPVTTIEIYVDGHHEALSAASLHADLRQFIVDRVGDRVKSITSITEGQV